jgi:hypothetical protein
MSPKLERFNEGVGALSRKALDKKSDALKGQAHTAIDEGNFDELNHITDRLSALGKDAPADLNKIMDDFNNFLSRYGIEEEDFSVEEFTEVFHTPNKLTSAEQTAQVNVKVKRNIKIRPAILLDLIAQNEEGGFVYKDLKAVAQATSEKFGISINYATDDRDKAKEVVRRRIKTIMLDPNLKTVRDVLEPMYKVKRKGSHSFDAFYQEAVRLYGDYDAERFVNEILYRHAPEQNKLIEQVKPIHEVILCGAFGRDDVREQIQELTGWQSKQMDALYKDIQSSHEKAGKKRIQESGKTSLDKDETRKAQNFIVEELIHAFTSRNNIYRNILNMGEFTAVRMLYHISKQFDGDMVKAEKLVRILFPHRKFAVDAQGYFISEKSSVGHLDSSSVNEGRGAI